MASSIGIKSRCFFLMVLFVFTVSCGRMDLYQNLTEEETNEILVLLSQNGIKASKKKVIEQNESSYTVQVREADLVKARHLLVQQSLPRRKELGLTGVYKEKGLIPTPDEQKARFLLALKGEIINSLERVPDIVDADVVLNVPQKDEFADVEKQKFQRPTASVVVRVKPSSQGVETISESKIQQFVANSVEGMNPRDVTVIISYIMPDEKAMRPGDVKTLAPEGFPGVSGQKPEMKPEIKDELIGLRLDAQSKGKLKIYLLIFFVLLTLVSAGLIVAIVKASRLRQTLASFQGSMTNYPSIDGQVVDEAPPRLPGGQGPPEEL